jgi:ribosomal protein S18 acetylase RimI-like enzyme
VSVNIEKRADDPGEAEYAERVWALKERIREREDVLKQRRGFFMDAYRRSQSHLLFSDDDLLGFVTVRRDGYVLFLAVAPEARGEGLGRQLVAEVARTHGTVSCHARTTNQQALEFYEQIGFDIERRIDNYYEDGGDAYYLKLGEEESIRGKISDFIRG